MQLLEPDHRKMASLIGRAKIKTWRFPDSNFERD